MPTLFARRSKGPAGGALSSLRFNQHQPVSSADLLASAAGDQDARPLPPVPFELPLPASDYAMPSHNSFRMHEFGALPPRDVDEKPLPVPQPVPQPQAQKRVPRSQTSRSTMPSASLRPAVSAATISTGGPPTRAKTRASMASGLSSGVTHTGFGHLSSRGAVDHVEPHAYGYCHASLDAQVDIAVVVQLVGALGDQIRQRGLDSPLIFSSMALDVSASNTCSLIRSFMSSHSAAAASSRSRGMPPSVLPAPFLSELRFANPHDLAAMLKWALARLGRVFAVPVPAVPGEGPNRKGVVEEDTIFVQQRGFLQLDAYLTWREDERTRQYPVTAFTAFIDATMDPAAAALLRALFSLLSSTAAYSLKNGMTPSKLARLFGPLIFGLPEDETFERTYDAFVRASNATEHLLLAYIRDISSTESLPVRLNDHLRGYPSMLSGDISRPARHVRGVPVTQIERVVRLYSADLVQSACELELSATCEEWAACCSTEESLGREPQLADRCRKLLNFRGSSGSTRRGDASNGAGSGSLVRQLSSHSNGRSTESELETHGSLASKNWADFSLDGFAAPDKSKLAFDLRESERRARIENRGTVKWSQFEESGFVATDEGLREVLSFDDGLQEDMARWPGERAQMLEKIRAQASKLPPFPYDTAPHCVASPLRGELSTLGAGQWSETPISRMDEMFPEVVADLLLGNGWSNRDELTHRNANFVVVQFKSRAIAEAQELSADSALGDQSVLSRTSDAPADDRTKAAWFVVQELVPSQYRADLDAAGRLKGRSKPSLRKLNIFKRVRRERDESTAADPHDPFSAGAGGATRHLRIHGPTSPTLSSSGTMAADLERGGTHASFRTQMQRRTDAGVPPGMTYEPGPDFMEGGSSSILQSLRSKTKRGRGRGDEATVPSLPSKQGIAHTQYDSFSSSDFETRSLNDPELDELTSSNDYTVRRKNPLARRHDRRESKDDAWIDVLSKANGFRMAGQDADIPPMRKGSRHQLASASEPGPSRAALPNLQLPPRDASLNDSLRNTPTQETFDEDARRGTTHPALGRDAAPIPPAAAIAAAGWSLEPAPEPERRRMLQPAVPERRSSSISEDASGSSSRPMDLTPPAAAPLPLPPTEPIQAPAVVPAPARLSPDSPDRSQTTTPVAEKASPQPASNSAAAPVSAVPEPTAVPSPDVSPVPVRRIVPPMPGPGATAAEKELARAARIEAAKERARELRAGLKDVRVPPAEPKDASEPQVSPSPPTNRPDPFAKNPTSGRVAAIAGKFGGPAKARLASLSPTNGAATSPSALSAVSSSREPASPSPARAALPSALMSGLPSQVRSSMGPPAPAPEPEAKSTQPAAAWTTTSAAPAETPTPASQGWTLTDPEAPPSPRVRESLDNFPDSDSIYPDDAASNYSRSTDDGGEPGSRSSAFLASRPDSMLSENGFAADALRSEEEDRAMELRREPYQPGMPLDNVAEESESMLSGSNGR